MPQKLLISSFHFRVRRFGWQAQPLHDGLREAPQNQQRERHHERFRSIDSQKQTDEKREPRRDLQVNLHRAFLCCAFFRFGGSLPFQQTLVGNRHAHDRAHHSINRDQALMAEARQPHE